jgi:hypothetical protein
VVFFHVLLKVDAFAFWCSKESDSDSDDIWERSSESESESSDDESRPISTLTADFFRKKYAVV